MVHFIQYFDGRAGCPTALAAWSFKKNSGFKDVKTYLYTPCIENCDDPLLQKVFDEILPPLWEVEQLKYLDWSKRYYINNAALKWVPDSDQLRARYCKLFSFMYHDCRADDLVFSLDWDTITVNPIVSYIKPTKFIFGCVKHDGLSFAKSAIWFSASCMYKTSGFECSDLRSDMEFAVLDSSTAALAEEYLPGSGDDSILTYLLNNYEYEVQALHEGEFESTLFNENVGLSGSVYHWAGTKPWVGTCYLKDMWFSYAHNMFDDLSLAYTDYIPTNRTKYRLANIGLGIL